MLMEQERELVEPVWELAHHVLLVERLVLGKKEQERVLVEPV